MGRHARLTDDGGNALPGWPRAFGGAGDQQVHDRRHGRRLPAAGVCDGPGASDADAYVVKLDANGDLAWERRIGGPGADVAQAVVALSGGGYALAGSSAPGGGAEYAWIVLLDERAACWPKPGTAAAAVIAPGTSWKQRPGNWPW